MSNLGLVIEYKLRQLGKFDGAKIRTEDGIIKEWSANGEIQPDKPTIDSWVSEYETAKASEGNAKKGRKRQLLDALATLTGLTRKQVLKCFMEIVQDGNDD